MYERCGSELERPYLSPEGKQGAYKWKRSRIFHMVDGTILPRTFLDTLSKVNISREEMARDALSLRSVKSPVFHPLYYI